MKVLRSIVLCIAVAALLRLQRVSSYVIVSKDQDVYGVMAPLPHGREDFAAERTKSVRERTDVKNLLELYYLIQVVRSYRRPSYLELAAIARGLFEQLTREEVRDELANMLTGVDGAEEIFNVGEYPAPDPLKEQLANDFRLLFPLVVKTLGELGHSRVDGMGRLQEKLRRAMDDFRSSLANVMRLESEVLNVIGQRNQPNGVEAAQSANSIEQEHTQDRDLLPTEKMVEVIYETEIPAAAEKDVVNDYDLEAAQITDIPAYEEITERALDASSVNGRNDVGNTLRFLPETNEVEYKVGPLSEEASQEQDDDDDDVEDERTGMIVLTKDDHLDDRSHATGKIVEAQHTPPKAVSVKDPEMLALMPVIVEQLREGNVTPEEQQTLAEIFGHLWPLMVSEADRLRTE